jgi:valyl-tRNA synthetase
VARQTEAALDAYKFNEAAGAVYQFVWHELCDWYLEAIKPTLYDETGSPEKAATLSVLWHVFKDALILLHPFAPFVTEEIWHSLPGTEGSIMKADLAGSYPARRRPGSRNADGNRNGRHHRRPQRTWRDEHLAIHGPDRGRPSGSPETSVRWWRVIAT